MNIPEELRPQYDGLPADVQVSVKRGLDRRGKSTVIAYLLWLIGCHYLYMGKIGIWLLYVFTGGGLLIWVIIDIFRMPSITRVHNEDLTRDLMVQYKALSNS